MPCTPFDEGRVNGTQEAAEQAVGFVESSVTHERDYHETATALCSQTVYQGGSTPTPRFALAAYLAAGQAVMAMAWNTPYSGGTDGWQHCV